MQKDIDDVQRWCNANRLTLNVSKTKIMSFMSDYKRKSCNNFLFYMKGTFIEEVESYRYLVTVLDNKLNGEFC